MIQSIGKKLLCGIGAAGCDFAGLLNVANARLSFLLGAHSLFKPRCFRCVGQGMAQCLFELDEPFAFGGHQRHDGDAELIRKCRRIETDAIVFGNIDHIECEDYGQAKFDELKGKLQVPLEGRGIDDIDDKCGCGLLWILTTEHA